MREDSLSCTESEMNEAVRGYIACDSLRMSPAKGVTVSGQVKRFASSQAKASQLSASFLINEGDQTLNAFPFRLPKSLITYTKRKTLRRNL